MLDQNTISELNKVLTNLNNLYKRDAIEHVINSENENLSYTVYKTHIEGIFIKVYKELDSYGENELITSIEFVKPIVVDKVIYDVI